MQRALLVFRWVALASMAINLVLNPESVAGRRPGTAMAALGLVAVWTLYLSRGASLRGRTLLVDVAVGAGLLAASGWVMPAGTIDTGSTLLAVTYPFISVLSAAAAYGPVGGAAAGTLLAAAWLFARLVNGLELTAGLLQRLWPNASGFVLLGLLFGVVANLLRRSSEEVDRATAEAIAAREQQARLAERESMARQIHDSALQVLALIHKRGRQLAESETVSPERVMELAEMARDQEVALRRLILREPDRPAEGKVSLRTALEGLAAQIREVEVSVSTVGPVWLPAEVAGELMGAVGEALANVVRHAQAGKVAVFADRDQGQVQVTVRDDGVGFEFDEARLVEEGKFGLLNSIKGRVEALGGQLSIDSKPGAGTELELQVPVPQGAAR